MSANGVRGRQPPAAVRAFQTASHAGVGGSEARLAEHAGTRTCWVYGPGAIAGIALLAYGVSALSFGGHSFGSLGRAAALFGLDENDDALGGFAAGGVIGLICGVAGSLLVLLALFRGVLNTDQEPSDFTPGSRAWALTAASARTTRDTTWE